MIIVYTFVSSDISLGGARMSIIFHDKVNDGWAGGRYISFGLDPEFLRIKPTFDGNGYVDVYRTLMSFVRPIIDDVYDIINIFKINPSFYQSCGLSGYRALQSTIEHIHRYDVPILLDSKFGDVGHTAAHHADIAYHQLGVDAVTVNPLVNPYGLSVYDEYRETPKGCFILCYPSTENYLAKKLYKDIARDFGSRVGTGLIVGATNTKILRHVRTLAGDSTPILIPGVGPQGGKVEQVVPAVVNNFLVNGGRRFLKDAYTAFCNCDHNNFAKVVRHKVASFNATIVDMLK